MEPVNINEVLPGEMLEQIFHLLTPDELKAAVMVCKRWAEVGQAPILWTWASITIGESDLGSIGEVLSSRKLSAVRRLRVTSPLSEETAIQAIVKHPGLKKVHLKVESSIQGSGGKPRLLAQLLGKLEQLELLWPAFNLQESKAMCAGLKRNKKLNTFCLKKNNITSLSPNLLSRALIHLQKLDLDEVELTREQTTAAFELLLTSFQLKKLRIRKVDLSFVEPSLMSHLVSKLEEVSLEATGLTSGQGRAIFEKLNETEVLRKLDLNGNSLSQVNADLLSKVVAKLEVANLSNTSLNPRQTVALCYELVYGSSKLTTLLLNDNNLSVVNRLVLARAVSQIEEVGLCSTSISTSQAEAVFAASVRPNDEKSKEFNGEDLDLAMLQVDIYASWHKKPRRLRRLDMRDNDLSSVDQKFLARAIKSLDWVNFEGTSMMKGLL